MYHTAESTADAFDVEISDLLPAGMVYADNLQVSSGFGPGVTQIGLDGLGAARHLGLPAQPTQRMFEALLWDSLRRIPPGSYALAEGESRHIGRVALPVRLYQALQTEVSLWIEAPVATRVRNILADYPARDHLREQFAAPLRALKERCGQQAVEEMLALLESGAWGELVRELMLRPGGGHRRHPIMRRLPDATGFGPLAGQEFRHTVAVIDSGLRGMGFCSS